MPGLRERARRFCVQERVEQKRERKREEKGEGRARAALAPELRPKPAPGATGRNKTRARAVRKETPKNHTGACAVSLSSHLSPYPSLAFPQHSKLARRESRSCRAREERGSCPPPPCAFAPALSLSLPSKPRQNTARSAVLCGPLRPLIAIEQAAKGTERGKEEREKRGKKSPSLLFKTQKPFFEGLSARTRTEDFHPSIPAHASRPDLHPRPTKIPPCAAPTASAAMPAASAGGLAAPPTRRAALAAAGRQHQEEQGR